jgi:4-carboxymuconolactone decarboxylase
VHAPEAEKLGVDSRALVLIGEGRVPEPLKDDERAVYEFCTGLHRDHFVSDGVYDRAHAALGNKGIVEIAALCGYYALLAMVMNVAQMLPPAGAKVPF